MKLKSFLSIVIASLAPVFAFGADGVTETRGPDGSGACIGPITDTTSRFFPQISESIGFQEVVPVNPKRSPGIPVGPLNSVPMPSVSSATQATHGPKFPGIVYTFLNPPDPFIAVGYSHIVEVVNTQVAFFDKAGNKQFQQSLSTDGFFSGVAQTSFVFDPKVIFDSYINRFIIVALDEDDSGQLSGILIGISDDGNPNGNWTKYRINAKGSKNAVNYWFDYPTVGSSKDGLVISGNYFSFGGNSYGFSRSYALRKSELKNGGVVNFWFFDHTQDFTLQPARTLENVTSTIYGAALRTTSSMSFYAWRNFLTTPLFSRIDVATPSFVNMTSDATSTNGATLDPLSDRMMDTSFRSGSLLMAHTVRVSAADNRAMVRWYEYLMNTWPVSGGITRKQFGNLSLATPNHVYMPAICKNGKGAISLLVTRSSTSRAADLYTASRTSVDALNAMGPFKLFGSSAGNYSAGFHRWGDYFSTTNDPSDAAKFWGVGELIQANGTWRTEIGSWSVN